MQATGENGESGKKAPGGKNLNETTRGGGGGVRLGNVPDKNSANRFLFHKANLPIFIHTGESFTPILKVRSS